MAYLGNNPDAYQYTVEISRFNGTGACTQFQIPQDIDDAKGIEVLVNSVQQDPDNAYSVTNGLITFTEAPSSGTNNVIVLRRTGTTYTRTQIDTADILPNAVTTAAIADNAITSAKIAPGTVIASDIADGSVTGPMIGLTAINANNIVDDSITAAKLAPGAALSNGQLSVVSSAVGVIADSASGRLPYKILGQIQPGANVLTTIYTVPASTNTVVTTITVCNQSANAVSVNVAANVSGSAVTTKNFIVSSYALGAAETLVLEPRISLNVGSILSANITGANASSNISINAFGVEII